MRIFTTAIQMDVQTYWRKRISLILTLWTWTLRKSNIRIKESRSCWRCIRDKTKYGQVEFIPLSVLQGVEAKSGG